MATKKKTSKKAPAKKKAAKKASKKGKAPTRGEMLQAALAGSAAMGHQSIVLADAEGELWATPSYYISTRSLAINKAMGLPGVPGGRLTEIAGPEGTGKSTLCDHLIAETQAKDGLAILIDTEHARDLTYMGALGVDPKKLIVAQLNYVEAVYDLIAHWAQEGRRIVGPGKPVLIVWDSVAGTPTKAEFEAESTDQFRAEAAKVNRRLLRKSMQHVARNQAALVFTNQVYSKMGPYGGTETYGGGGIKYWCSVRINLFCVGRIWPRGLSKSDKAAPIGEMVNARLIKNKLAPPQKERRFAIVYGQGVDNTWTIWHDNCGPNVKPPDNAFIHQSGSWYALDETLGGNKWQGAHWGLAELIHQRPELWGELVDRYEGLPA